MTITAATHGLFTENWAILATEAAAVLLILVLTIGLISWLGRRKRISAARALLDERDDLAETATETFHTHVQALATGKTLTPDELDDYEQRSLQLINELVEPWLEPSAENLRDAVRQIMTIRHNDLHQIAAIFRQQQVAEPISDNSANAPQIQQLQSELAASQKAEAERSAQLAEALKSVSIIVGEYGRKFGVEADYRVPQILRALIYLQSIDKGMNQQEAVDAADASMNSGIDVFEEENLADTNVKATPSTAAPDPVLPSAPEPKPSPKAPEREPQIAGITASTAQTEIKKYTASTKETTTSPEKQLEEQKVVDLAETSREPKSDEIKSVEKVSIEEQEATEEQIDLDAVELPEKSPINTEFNLDLDDIDALLDAEISRQQEKVATPTPLPNQDDDELDLSKKP